MSLFEEVERAKNPFSTSRSPDESKKKVSFINQTSSLLSVLNELMSSERVPVKKAKDCEGFRSKLGDCCWPLHNLQGKVTEESWRSIVKNSITGMLKTIRNSQPNGEWMLMDYEVKIDFSSDGIERLFLAVKFVDIDNTEELLYRNGVPVTTTVNVNTSPIAPEVIEALTNRSTDDSDLKDMIMQLVVALGSQHTSKDITVNPDHLEPYSVEAEPVSFDD
tara:strand:+ start:7325 stop:7984 length:660 start_codon:yes stop_codon:yes gene_type:complete